MTESNNNITSSRGESTNFLAEIADKIGEALINNPQLKTSMIKHAEKVIQKAEEYGQYLRTEWQKAKEAGLTQHDENKDEEEWSWWTAYSKDWSSGECVYFADDESLCVQFYIKGKPKPDPLSYLHSMIWGSVGEDYVGLELLDYQFVLLAIIHDAQNWQAGRKRIYFNPLKKKTLSDRLCRAVWHHLESKIDSYNFRDVKNTIKTALQTIKANLKQETKNSGDNNTTIPEPNKEKAKKLHEIADALEEWRKYDEKITNTAEWNTAAAKQIIRKALTLLVNNLVLLNECKNKYGYHNPLRQCFMAIEHAASLPETKDLGDFWSWTGDFTKRHLSGGERRSLAGECVRYANKVNSETEKVAGDGRDNKTTTPEPEKEKGGWGLIKKMSLLLGIIVSLVLIYEAYNKYRGKDKSSPSMPKIVVKLSNSSDKIVTVAGRGDFTIWLPGPGAYHTMGKYEFCELDGVSTPTGTFTVDPNGTITVLAKVMNESLYSKVLSQAECDFSLFVDRANAGIVSTNNIPFTKESIEKYYIEADVGKQ